MKRSRILYLAIGLVLLPIVSGCPPSQVRIKPIAGAACNDTKAELFIEQEGAAGVASSALVKADAVDFQIGASTSNTSVFVAGHAPSPAPQDRRLHIYTADPVTLTLKLRCSLGTRKLNGVLDDFPRQNLHSGRIVFTLPFDKFAAAGSAN